MVQYSEEQKNCEHDFSKCIAAGLDGRIHAMQEDFHSDAKYYCSKCHAVMKPNWFPDHMTARQIVWQYEQAIWLMAEQRVQKVENNAG